MRLYLVYLIYVIILFSLFPIIQFETYKVTNSDLKAASFFIWFRIFLSSPLLILFGIGLITFYGNEINKILGCLSVTIGIYWLCVLLKDIISEITIF